MFGGNNVNPLFPNFPVFLEDNNQFPYDSNTSTQLQLFANTFNQPIKRSREAEDFARAHMLQISLSSSVQDELDLSASIPNPNVVSTGLRLSLDDDEHNSSVTTASGSMPSLPIMMSLGDNLRIEIDRQREEFDHYIRIQEEHIAKEVKEIKHRHMASFLGTIEKEVGKKLREKEVEIESMNRKNRELVERIKQVAVEAQSWHYRAQYNESVVNVLKNNLKQALAQGADQVKEGCGDSEVDDAASTYNASHVHGRGLTGVMPLVRFLGNKGSSSGEQMTCKACKTTEVSILLLPCRHLCLCLECEGFIDVCPVCQSLKNASVQVYMS
ncbi:E3 ubiquitin-protein ligase BOI-like protein [Dioscorea alata]|nr:E3 ubiquitin-protein ligase BOI-like protein [Dioscorea alata]